MFIALVRVVFLLNFFFFFVIFLLFKAINVSNYWIFNYWQLVVKFVKEYTHTHIYTHKHFINTRRLNFKSNVWWQQFDNWTTKWSVKFNWINLLLKTELIKNKNKQKNTWQIIYKIMWRFAKTNDYLWCRIVEDWFDW